MTKKNKVIPQYGINYKTMRRKFRTKPRYTRRPSNAPGCSAEVADGCAAFIYLLFTALIPIR